MSSVNRVVILGAESSGKSILAEALAEHYQTVWVPECLREFVEQHQRVPRQEEQILIARTQVQREAELLKQAKQWLFCDTGPIMTAIYSRHYFGEPDAELAQLELSHQYDFCLVTAPDFPWQPDGLQRESAYVRDRVHEEVLNVLDDRQIPFLLVEGSQQARLEQVQFALSFLLS